MWDGYKNYDHHYTMNGIDKWFGEIFSGNLSIVKSSKGVEYFNIPASFDIETSSFRDDEDEPHALMYLWGCNINGSVIIGRTWDELLYLFERVKEIFNLSPKKTILVIYVHNLGYEFQWIRKRVKWVYNKVFSIKERRPIYALSEYGIEFRCSYILSNYSLDYIGSQLLTKYPVTKKVGYLNYELTRTPLTKLTDKEVEYQCDDTRVVTSYIQEKIETDGSILDIPLTNTGYVRNYCRESCLHQNSKDKKAMYEYRILMKNLKIQTEKEYNQLKQAFMGGFTHANPNYSCIPKANVGSADLTSSYPFTMVADYFPMSGGSFIGEVNDEELLDFYLKNFCCLFTIKIYGLYSAVFYDSYISISHCTDISDDKVVNNGRLVSADWVQLNITELDYDIIEKIYDWDYIEIYNMRIYRRSYLPKSLILAILNLYGKKTSLKGVEDKQVEYMVSKNMINSAYGMAVTNIVRDEISYHDNDEWEKEPADPESQLNKYNSSFSRFLSYAWGVWVTAHARHHLWDAIMEFGDDYIYADTDSIKGLNFDKHMDFFEYYNFNVEVKLRDMCRYHNIPFELCCPKTIKGETKMIGVWDMEEPYLLFKTIGAKRYIYEHQNHEFGMTVAGVNKSSCIPYLLYMFGGKKYHTDEWLDIFKLAYSNNPDNRDKSKQAMKKVINERVNSSLSYEKVIEAFSDCLYIPPDFTGKQTLTYIDDEETFTVTDYLGNIYTANEKSAIHMQKAPYFFSMAVEYINYLNGLRDDSL